MRDIEDRKNDSRKGAKIAKMSFIAETNDFCLMASLRCPQVNFCKT